MLQNPDLTCRVWFYMLILPELISVKMLGVRKEVNIYVMLHTKYYMCTLNNITEGVKIHISN